MKAEFNDTDGMLEVEAETKEEADILIKWAEENKHERLGTQVRIFGVD